MSSGIVKTQQDSNEEPRKYKLVFIGEQGVGKTSIITRFMYNTFDMSYQATIGIDFLSKTMYTETRTVRLQLWDTAGQERFRCLVATYIRDSTVAILVFDITNRESFNAVDKWVKDVKDNRKSPMIVIIGNKCDLDKDRVVSTEEAEEKAKSHDATYHEGSAKLGTNINQIFRKITSNLPLNGESAPKNALRDNDYNLKLEYKKRTESGYSCTKFCNG